MQIDPSICHFDPKAVIFRTQPITIGKVLPAPSSRRFAYGKTGGAFRRHLGQLGTECQRQINLLTRSEKPHHAHPNRPYPRISPPCDFQKSQDPNMPLAA